MPLHNPMRWLFHPLIFFPAAILAAALIIAIGLQPQSWLRAPAAIEGRQQDGALILAGPAFNSPAPAAQQNMTVVRDFLGRAQALRIAVLPNQPPPGPTEQGVRILLTREAAATIDDKAVIVELAYEPLAFNSASHLAVSLQGIGPATWVTQAFEPEPGRLRFELPAQAGVSALGLRPLAASGERASGLEIREIRITPRA